ncbi:MAG: hypothetical protein ABIR36_07270 [Nitrospiraceae bacterium]
MDKTQRRHQHNGGEDREESHPCSPYWRRVHHHWYFWVGMFLMLVAIGIYVMTEDLSWLQPTPKE